MMTSRIPGMSQTTFIMRDWNDDGSNGGNGGWRNERTKRNLRR